MASLVPVVTFTNGDFSGGLNGWTTLNQRVRLGGLDKVAGFSTPVDPTTAPDGGMEASSLSSQAYTTVVDGAGRAVMTSNQSGVANTPPGSGGIVHGPVIFNSTPVPITAGTTVQFDWEASGGSDAFDVFGYIVSTTGATQIILDATGAYSSSSQPITTVKFTVPQTDSYTFVFVSGTWDATKGQATGARLSIDNILISPFGFTGGGDSLGDTVSFTVNFDAPVNGLIGGTNTTIFKLNNVGVSAQWSGTNGSTTRKLTFTVAPGQSGQLSFDEAALLVALSASEFSGTDGKKVGLPPSLPDFDTGGTALPVVDGIRPSVTISSDKNALKIGETTGITFSFTEDPGSSFTWDGKNGDVSVSSGTLSPIAGSGLTRTATFTPAPGLASGVATITVAEGSYTDPAGNPGLPGTSSSIRIGPPPYQLPATSPRSRLATQQQLPSPSVTTRAPVSPGMARMAM